MFKKAVFKKVIFLTAALYAGASNASLLTNTSGNGLDVTTLGVSTIGGVVVDLVGTNGSHVVSQLAASDLFVGFYDGGTPIGFNGNPGTIGIQTGFDAGVLAALGGGISSASIRFTLFDGDTEAVGFDFNDNTLLVNGLDFGNWSDVDAEQTNALGASVGPTSGGGFRDDILDTGWFTSSDNALMASLFSELTFSGEMLFQIQDDDPFDNFFDFTLGIDQDLIDVGQGPTTGPVNPVSEPAALSLVGLCMFVMLRLRRKKQ
jgi:hypothetical protein